MGTIGMHRGGTVFTFYLQGNLPHKHFKSLQGRKGEEFTKQTLQLHQDYNVISYIVSAFYWANILNTFKLQSLSSNLS